MVYRELKKRMVLFSLEDLKSFLGADLVEQLALEWSTNESRITKGLLSDVLLNVNGTAVLQNQTFRKTLLRHMTIDEIGTVLNVSRSTVKRYMKSGKQRIISRWESTLSTWVLNLSYIIQRRVRYIRQILIRQQSWERREN